MIRLSRLLAAATLSAAVLLSACAKLAPEVPTPTPIPTPSIGNRQTYQVVRGTIGQQVKALGRVTSEQQATLYFRTSGRLFHISVDTNQTVKKGQLLAEMDVTDLKKQVQIAQVQAEIAQLQVDAAMGKAVSGGESAAVISARSALAQAEANYAQSQDALDQLLIGPTRADVDAAKASVVAAEQKLLKDQTALTLLQTPPTPDQLTILRANVDKAQAALQQAQAAYDRVKFRPDVGALPQSLTLQQATITYNSAKAAFDQAVAGPKADDVANARQQVASDQKALDAAKAKLTLLQQGATSQEIDAARQTVASAKAALDTARVNLATAQDTAAGTSVDVQIAKKQADVAKLQLETLQHQLDEAQIRAPFDGVVTETDAKDGDNLQAYAPVLSVSNPAKLQISVELQPSDLAQVALGMPATIVLSAFPTTKLEGKVIRMPTVTTGDTSNLPATLRTVAVSFPNPPGVVNLGDLANITIDVQRKEGVLLIPTATILSTGGKQYVHVLTKDGHTREVYIQVGISDDTNTEVMKGLQEGETVILPTTVPPTPVAAGGQG
jgi:HlyD family secretion protein